MTWNDNEIITSHGAIISVKKNNSWWQNITNQFAITHAQSVDENTIVFSFIGDLSNADGVLEFYINNVKLTNPADIGSHFVTISFYGSSDGTGYPTEVKNGLVYINENINVTATIPSSLEFTILGVGSSESVNGATTDLSTTATAIDFGLYTGNQKRTGAHDLLVSTNSTDGYVVTVQYDHALSSSAGDIMNDFVGTNSAPVLWTEPTGSGIESFFGYTTNDNLLTGISPNRFIANKWAGLSSTPGEVAHYTDPTVDRTTRVGYQLELTNLQPAGVYSNSIMYICTATY